MAETCDISQTFLILKEWDDIVPVMTMYVAEYKNSSDSSFI